MFENRFAFNSVERLPYFRGWVSPVIQVANECRYRPLEINVVFPQRVVGVNEQSLAGGKLRHDFYGSESTSST